MPARKLDAKKKKVEARIDTLRSDLDALQAKVKGGVSEVGDVASARAEAVVHSAGELAEKALRLAEETAMDLANRM